MEAENIHRGHAKSSRVIFTFLFFILKTVLMLMLAAMCKGGRSPSHSGLREWCAIPWQLLVAMEKCVFPDSLESSF